MSLAVAALRIAAVKALDSATSAGARVYDSAIDPLDLLGDKALPTIIVYTDVGHIDLKDKSVNEAPHTVDLTFEMFIGRAITVQLGGGDSEVQLEVPATDAGYENYLRGLAYEVNKALGRRDGVSPWPDLYSALIARGDASSLSEWDRGANAEKGRRFAFLRLIYRYEIMNDPVPGAALTELWTRLFAAMDADTELADISAYWQKLITDPAVPDWRQAQIELGLTDAGIGGSGIAPAFATTTDAAPANTEISGKFTDEPALLVGDPAQATIAENGGDPVKIAE